MKNFLKIKKRKIVILLFLFCNQFLLSGHALNNKKIDLVRSEKNNLQRKFYTTFNYLLAGRNKDQINNNKIEAKEKEAKEIEDFANEIDVFLEETLPINNFEDLKNQKNNTPFENKKV